MTKVKKGIITPFYFIEMNMSLYIGVVRYEKQIYRAFEQAQIEAKR